MECAQATLRFRRRRLLREEKYENAHKWKLGHSLSLNWLQIQFFPSFYLTLLFAGTPPPPSATCSTLKRPNYTICALILRYFVCAPAPPNTFIFWHFYELQSYWIWKRKENRFHSVKGRRTPGKLTQNAQAFSSNSNSIILKAISISHIRVCQIRYAHIHKSI